ncbi:hypothetical protein GP486_005271 [Trichoglossum hirsutum]|uniref:Uncharacterized protein n=1 Tax=Trichoglossum hirsutum TaxID=265104 RepID=A0A9P8L9G7_9PEZI|nr:hypothetical protein GP486_005271 [Trichoglossum hirsutum]
MSDSRKNNFIQIESLWMRVPDHIFGLAISRDSSGEADTIDESFWCRNLVQTNWKETTGLTFDLEWGGVVKLAFPWAVYQVKSTQNSDVLSEAALGAEMALRMLNDLALEPGRPDERRAYQTPTSDCFQVFAFTSEGPKWKIYICFRVKDIEGKKFANETSAFEMKRIWTGNISHETDAWTLIALIGQIREWARTEHRCFVFNHLRKWNNYYESLNAHSEQKPEQDKGASEGPKA